jgi:hypothetical protein
MKSKIFNLLLIISSLFGYLEWGKGQHMFLFRIEAKIFSKFFGDPLSVLHPFVLLPFIGQVLLLVSLFQKTPYKILTYSGIGGIGLLLALVFLVGCLSRNPAIIGSTVPFAVVAFLTIRNLRNTRQT